LLTGNNEINNNIGYSGHTSLFFIENTITVLHTYATLGLLPSARNSAIITVSITIITAGTLVPSSVNGDVAIQWEWSNFDPSENPNPLTDYDKTLHT